MLSEEYIYNVNYQITDEELCKLEMRSLFGFSPNSKAFFSKCMINPSASPFLKNRLNIIYKTSTFEELIEKLKENTIVEDDFKVKYVQLQATDPYINEKRRICREVALTFEGFHSFEEPKRYYGISFFENYWYFGILEKNRLDWKKHNKKPYSYSSSLGINLAKALVNIASNGDKSISIIDPCCGAGTVLLEGLYAGYNIRGGEINYKVAENARVNLRHFDYLPKITTGDINDIKDYYDVSIVDLPYGISVKASDELRLMIIRNARRISKKIVLVSSNDISNIIQEENFTVLDSCTVIKNENRDFARFVWVLKS